MTVAEIRADILDAVENQSPAMFSWPDDHCYWRDWYYWVHCAWVVAWNTEGRVTDVQTFLRRWISDDGNIQRALEAKRDFEGNLCPRSGGYDGQR